MQRGKQSYPVLRHVLVLATKRPLNKGVPAPHPPAHLPLPGSSLKSGWKSTLHALSPPRSLTFERLPSFISRGRPDRSIRSCSSSVHFKTTDMDSTDTCRVLSIQSHVVSGYVGNDSATFPLQVSLITQHLIPGFLILLNYFNQQQWK